ncbi:MAG: type II toxin-antitoxin system HicB family antitoxin [Isosphaeraceae bacterium]
MKLKVLIRPESVGGYSASVPALPGCYSEGENLREAIENIREAAELWLEVASEKATAVAENDVEAVLQEIEL